MIDIRFLRENPEAVKENIRKKFQDAKLPLVDEVVDLDAKRRAAIAEVESLKAARNKLSKANGPLYGQLKKCDDEKILLPLQHAEDSDMLVQLAIMMRNKKLNRGLIGLNVIFDDINSSRNLQVSARLLDHAATTASAADVRMQVQTRLAINIANGIKHAFKENDASEIIMGLHRRPSVRSSSVGLSCP